MSPQKTLLVSQSNSLQQRWKSTLSYRQLCDKPRHHATSSEWQHLILKENEILRFVFWFHSIISGLQTKRRLHSTSSLLDYCCNSEQHCSNSKSYKSLRVCCRQLKWSEVSGCCFNLSPPITWNTFYGVLVPWDLIWSFVECFLLPLDREWNLKPKWLPAKDTDHLCYQLDSDMKHLPLLKNPVTSKRQKEGQIPYVIKIEHMFKVNTFCLPCLMFGISLCMCPCVRALYGELLVGDTRMKKWAQNSILDSGLESCKCYNRLQTLAGSQSVSHTRGKKLPLLTVQTILLQNGPKKWHTVSR